MRTNSFSPSHGFIAKPVAAIVTGLLSLPIGIENSLAANNLGAFLQADNGLVSMEAEHYHSKVALGGYDWTPAKIKQYSGPGALQALPDDTVTLSTQKLKSSPRAEFQVKFKRAGKHEIWIRALGKSASANSLHVGLGGKVLTLHPPKGQDYVWVRGSAALNVASAGIHTVSIWMRESGTIVDKLVLTPSGSYKPQGVGPNESPRGDGTAPPLDVVVSPSISPSGGTFDQPASVSIDSATEGAVITYTLDGTYPTLKSNLYGGPFLVSKTATLKTRGFLGGYESSSVTKAKFVINQSSPTSPPTGNEGFFVQGTNGLVAFEAENHQLNVAQGNLNWKPVQASGQSGSASMQALPDGSPFIAASNLGKSPRMEFKINFKKSGAHTLWARGKGKNAYSNSLYMGLNGAKTKIRVPVGSQLGWGKGASTFQVPSPGVYTVSVWMRQSGTVLDKLLITSNASYKPSGKGPSESPFKSGNSGPNVPKNEIPVARADQFTTVEGQKLKANVLANDSGLANTPITLSVFQAPSNGSAWVSGNTIVYRPKSKFIGSDTFMYKITDADGESAVASTNVKVTVGNSPTDISKKKVELSWRPNVEKVKGYIVHFGTSPNTAILEIARVSSATPAFNMKAPSVQFEIVKELGLKKAGDSGCFRLKAYDSAGASGLSEAACFSI